MSYTFPSEAWIKELRNKLNASDAYKQAAKKWEGAITFVVQPGAGLAEEKYLYLDLMHGDCLGAKELESAAEENAPFTISAPIEVWKSVVKGELDPIKAITGRKLKLQGNLMQVLKAPKAAVELVNCCKEIDTSWPA